MHISAIILAAGESKRFGNEDKILSLYKDKPVIEHVLESLTQSESITETIVVINDKINKKMFQKPCALSLAPCAVIVNNDYKQGMGTSLREGVKASRPNTQGFLIALADMPLVKSETVQKLIEEFKKNPTKIIIPVCENRKGHPVILPGDLKTELLTLSEDKGARDVIKKYAERVMLVSVDDKGILFDVDFKKDLENV